MDDLLAALEAIPDHRDRRGRVYPLASLLAIHVLAAVGDANSPEDAADFARDHAAWLRGLGLLGERVPSAQTLRRLLRDRGSDLLAELQPLVMRLATACEAAAEEEKKPEEAETEEGRGRGAAGGLCRRRQVGAPLGRPGPRPAPHAHRLGTAGQRPDDRPGGGARQGQGNELTAIRQPPPALDLEDRVVSIDAMGCRTDVAETIAAADGWYLLAVTDSESNLHLNLRGLRLPGPHRRRGPRPARDRGAGARTHRTAHLHHPGRRPRHPGRNRSDRHWAGLGCAVRMVAERTVRGRTTRAVRYYISNLPVTVGAARMANFVRATGGDPLGARTACTGCWTTPSRRPLPPAHRPCRPQHGGPAARRPEHSDPPATVFLAKIVNSPAAQDGGPHPARLEPLMAL